MGLKSNKHLAFLATSAALIPALVTSAQPVVPQLTNVTAQAKVNYEHQIVGESPSDSEQIVAGAAAADYDGDGYIDLFAVGGNAANANMLFRNRGDGSLVFDQVADAAGIDTRGMRSAGAAFADLNGDGHLDLLVGAVEQDPILLFLSDGQGGFDNASESSGLSAMQRPNSFSPALADIDADGDLDLALSHWLWNGSFDPQPALSSTETLWLNDGHASFSDHSGPAGFTAAIGQDGLDFSFTPNFSDINDDGRPDLLLASDFGTSQVFINRGNGEFEETTTDVISDRNGMGATVGDYDNDGDMDWFVTAIAADGVDTPGFDGNRLYRNDGDGQFEDVTDAAGVRVGGWGWGSCFADLNNDGLLDIVHVNGWSDQRFSRLASKLFIANGDGSFSEMALAAGLFTDRQGRGLVCADFDRDGDVDIYLANNRNFAELYRNDTVSDHHWLTIQLRDNATTNRFGIGAKLTIHNGDQQQTREIRVGNNFVSHGPAEAHFGLGDDNGIERLTVRWPDGDQTVLTNLSGDHVLTVQRSAMGQISTWQRYFDVDGRKPEGNPNLSPLNFSAQQATPMQRSDKPTAHSN